MAPRPALERLIGRPDAKAWKDDELVTLAEAAALFFPGGPMSASALRRAFDRGELRGVRIAGKLFTTPGDLRAMTLTSYAGHDGRDDPASACARPLAFGRPRPRA